MSKYCGMGLAWKGIWFRDRLMFQQEVLKHPPKHMCTLHPPVEGCTPLSEEKTNQAIQFNNHVLVFTEGSQNLSHNKPSRNIPPPM